MEQKLNFIVYRVVNTRNDLIYIGSTSKSIEERKSDHLLKAKHGQGSYFQNAISTYGAEAFTWEQIDSASNPNELAEKEKQYILQYTSLEEGYNSDSGGGIKKTVYQYGIKGDLFNEYDCLENAAKAVNAGKKTICNACLGYNKTCKGYYWIYTYYTRYPIDKDLLKMKVFQFDSKDILIAEYESVSKASEGTGVSKTCIARVCRGEREQTGGFIFKYA